MSLFTLLSTTISFLSAWAVAFRDKEINTPVSGVVRCGHLRFSRSV